MAKKLENFSFKEERRKLMQQRMVPLDKFLDGNTWELVMEDAKRLEKEQGYLVGSVYKSLRDFRVALVNRGLQHKPPYRVSTMIIDKGQQIPRLIIGPREERR